MSRMDPRARRGLPGDAQGRASGLPYSRNRRAMRLVGELGAKVVRAVHEAERRDADGATGAAGPETSSDLSWYDFALEYLAMRWPTVAPNSRDETNEGLAAVTKAMLLDTPGRPEDAALHRALRSWAFVAPGPAERDLPHEAREVLAWVAAASRPAVGTVRRKRKVLVNAVQYGIERGLFADNPVTRSRWRAPNAGTCPLLATFAPGELH